MIERRNHSILLATRCAMTTTPFAKYAVPIDEIRELTNSVSQEHTSITSAANCATRKKCQKIG
jgi:hypothetical protein